MIRGHARPYWNLHRSCDPLWVASRHACRWSLRMDFLMGPQNATGMTEEGVQSSCCSAKP